MRKRIIKRRIYIFGVHGWVYLISGPWVFLCLFVTSWIMNLDLVHTSKTFDACIYACFNFVYACIYLHELCVLRFSCMHVTIFNTLTFVQVVWLMVSDIVSFDLTRSNVHAKYIISLIPVFNVASFMDLFRRPGNLCPPHSDCIRKPNFSYLKLSLIDWKFFCVVEEKGFSEVKVVQSAKVTLVNIGLVVLRSRDLVFLGVLNFVSHLVGFFFFFWAGKISNMVPLSFGESFLSNFNLPTC